MTGLPPVLGGAANATDTDPFPGVAVTPVGAPGTVRGVTAILGDDAAALLPAALAEVTSTNTSVPFAMPVIVQPSTPVVEHPVPTIVPPAGADHARAW